MEENIQLNRFSFKITACQAHDNHFENTLCDLYAKMQASSD
ncbi:MAG: hypothetical protein PF484_02325 [Bacteroidales bacterium]|nr:hypothetical protein [Bacteroidales bacterium]